MVAQFKFRRHIGLFLIYIWALSNRKGGYSNISNFEIIEFNRLFWFSDWSRLIKISRFWLAKNNMWLIGILVMHLALESLVQFFFYIILTFYYANQSSFIIEKCLPRRNIPESNKNSIFVFGVVSALSIAKRPYRVVIKCFNKLCSSRSGLSHYSAAIFGIYSQHFAVRLSLLQHRIR